MVLFNYSTKELTAKIVYYGPGLCGKTTNLQYIHGNLPGNVKGKMLSLATKTDRTLFFDFLPIDLGEIRGMKTRVQLYTVPGQVFYNETRKLVLKGADGIVFVADSQEQMLSANVESFKNLEENLKGHGLKLAEMPHVIQLNKRDLPKLATIEQLNEAMNKYNAPFYESVATTGIGVQDTLKAITKLVLLHLTKKYDPRAAAATATQAAPVAPAAPTVEITPEPVAATPGSADTQAIPLASIQPSIDAPTVTVASTPPEPRAAEAAVPVESGPTIAVATSPPPGPAPAVARAEPPAPAAGAGFDDNEIDELVGEVEELEEIAAEPAVHGTFEIDETNVAVAENVQQPPTLTPAAEPADMAEPQPFEAFETPAEGSESLLEAAFKDEAEGPSAEAAAEPSIFDVTVDDAADEVLLTQVAADNELFEDPSLDVAAVGPGAEREILIPVELGPEGAARRFKLSVRLRLDPVD